NSSLRVEEAFLAAKNEFLKGLGNQPGFDFSQLASADDVVDAAIAIQQQRADTQTFHWLARITPLITVLQDYSSVVDTFVQFKPDVLCLIWGPLKIILEAASSLTTVFQNIVNALGEMQLALPSFKKYKEIFPQNDVIRQILLLFFEDILELYSVLLNFVTNNSQSPPKLMQSHKALMTEAVTLEDIVRAQQDRNLSLAEYDRAQKFRDYQELRAIRDQINPDTCYEKLDHILRKATLGSGSWLDREEMFMKWLDPLDRTVRCFWLWGIPGAGKTFLAGIIIQFLQRTGQCVLFTFFAHDNQSAGKTLAVLHSMLFQALEQVPSLQVLLPDHSSPDRRKLLRHQDFVMEILCRVLVGIGPSYIVLDGLDEIEESCCRDLLIAVLYIKERCAETKVLISSREARDIGLVVKGQATAFRIDKYNYQDIQTFVHSETENLLLRFDGANEQVRSRVRAALESIVDKSDSMFLYAQLVLHVVKDLGTAEEIQAEVENLPGGLDKAYGWVISRIEKKGGSNNLWGVIRRMLMWIACATRPLREEELLQALAVDVGAHDFTRGRKDYRDIRHDCGPIIEVLDGVVRFTHFSAKEYLLHEQSNKFLKMADAHLDAALTCGTYLSFTSLDSLLSTTSEAGDIYGQILNGDFVLLEYAALQYMDHIKGWMANKTHDDSTEPISIALNQLELFECRQNRIFNYLAPPEPFINEFKVFQADPLLQRRLASTLSFLTSVKIGMVDMAAFCSAYTSGFETSTSLLNHLEIHSPSHPCHFPNCLFANTGFRSSDELSRHIKNAHEMQNMPDFSSGATNLAVLPEQVRLEFLHEALVNGEFDAVRDFATGPVLARSPEKTIVQAGWNSPPDVLAWLLDQESFKR
ncbi:hypothetical protein F5144DRAFT_641977, partial [Chaetomium tenue]